MLSLKESTQFRRDLKRELRNPDNKDLVFLLSKVLDFLQNQLRLPEKYQVHQLKGRYIGYLECHLKPDLLLIYRSKDGGVLELVRLGSHSDLFR